jgi:choline dehydrogenase-like flavoprotein
MPIIEIDSLDKRYDVVVAGTGFGSLFFLLRHLERFPDARVLLIEWGSYRDQAWQLENQQNSLILPDETYVQQPGEKPWNFTIGYGGGTNCWWAQTPRMAPEDFRLRSTHGIGEDWPLSYDDLEPFYSKAERVMRIAGPNDLAKLYPRSEPYPQPPHNLSDIDKTMKAAMPGQHFAAPTARLSIPVGQRSACCATAHCDLCPVGAKFTALNSLGPLIERENVHLIMESRVLSVETAVRVATGLRFSHAGAEHVIGGDLVCVGANAIQTPFILQRSGFRHPALGRYLHEAHVLAFEVLLDGLDNFGGGTPLTSINTTWATGDHRKHAAAALVEFLNIPRYGLRSEWGRWRQTAPIEVAVEDLPLATNYVADEGGDYPVVHYPSRSAYVDRGVERVVASLPALLEPLPVEAIIRTEDVPTGSHVQGTCRMGSDPATSIVDGGLIHHEVRNLLILGTAVFPTCTTSEPSLTAAALSLRAADRLAT